MQPDQSSASAPASGKKQVSRRSILAAVPAAMLMTAAAACGKSSGSSMDSEESHSGTVTLTYALWDQEQLPAMKQIIAEFEKTNPKIRVRTAVTPFDSYWTKLQTAATGGSAPDVFWMNLSYFQLYASNEILLPLTKPIADAKIDMTQYEPAITKGYTLGKDVYALPKDIDSIGLWYNKKLFAEAGLRVPDASWKWSDLIAAAQRLTKGEVHGIAATLSAQETYYNTIPQNNGYVISPDGKKSGWDLPATIEGLQFWTDLINKYHVSPTLQQMTDTEPNQMFGAGKVAMYYGGSWESIAFKRIPYAKENVDVAPLPQGKVAKTVSNGLGNVIYAKTKYPREAWEFVKFLGSRRAAEIQGETGTVIPATKGSGTQDAWVKSTPEFNLQTFVDEFQYNYAFPVSVNTAVWSDYATKTLADAWTAKRPVATVAKDLAKQMNEALAKEPSRPS
ncbi:ABC transporter substrate-binding protein [Actinopolymorpha pittospori]|uniref:Multiple sugar transport system substrate-binding protein n=1 Tax=Actinopolymorpha pittospori TaxID=648752 RepID=A0A927MVC4_9ACTN|nr:sugar ABC transporter substrate-binding protein [Actinopolymorpha pittospori]MBE1603985.1 multiple sugar transport system substrate-binding protein [Actinopolymorpha pittospori]